MSMTDPAPTPLDLTVRFDQTIPVLVMPDVLPFEQLREWLRVEMPKVLPQLDGRAVRLDLGGRELQLFDVRRLLHLLRDAFQVDVTGLYVQEQAVHRYAERELKLKLFIASDATPDTGSPSLPDDAEDAPEASAEDGAPDAEAIPGMADALAALLEASDDDAPEAFEPAPAQRRPVPLPELPEPVDEVDDHGGRRVLTVQRTLRSGSALRYDGDIHVFGDVNAGAQVRAGGNVIVFGRCRGMVHAGAHGDGDAFILAFDLCPTQLRIAREIAIAPDKATSDGFQPEMARILDDAIVIEPYRGRIPRR